MPAPLYDTHAHLCAAELQGDLEALLARAAEVGVRGVVAVGENLADAERNLALAARYPGFVRPAAGLFPTYLETDVAAALEAWIRRHRSALVAIGEVGLDHWKVTDEPGRQVQRAIFGGFVDLARELDLPLNVHSRSAGTATVELLLARGATRVQLHAFDGRAARTLPAAEAGYFFSVPPSVVRSRQKQKLVRRLPLSALLLETDSPVLGPDPGVRNEPANVRVSLEAIAELKDLPIEAVREAVAANTWRLYGPEAFAQSPDSPR